MGLDTLVKLSNGYGSNEEYVLAGGGNTSYKDERFLYIKGSGTTLADITAGGFVKMDRGKLRAMWEKAYSSDPARREAQVLADLMDARIDLGKRPSVETSLHDLFPQSYVVHTHPALVNGLTCARDGRRIAFDLYGDDIIWIEPTMPGYVLAAEVKREIDALAKRGKAAKLVFLANHGVFAAGDTPEEIHALMRLLMEKLQERIPARPDMTPQALPHAREREALLQALRPAFAVFASNPAMLSYLRSRESFTKVESAFTPDHMVYYKHKALFVPKDASLEEEEAAFEKRYGFAPKIVAFQGLGAFALEDSEKGAKTAAALFNDTVKIAYYADALGGGVFMPGWLIDFIEGWEVESYRKSQSK